MMLSSNLSAPGKAPVPVSFAAGTTAGRSWQYDHLSAPAFGHSPVAGALCIRFCSQPPDPCGVDAGFGLTAGHRRSQRMTTKGTKFAE